MMLMMIAISSHFCKIANAEIRRKGLKFRQGPLTLSHGFNHRFLSKHFPCNIYNLETRCGHIINRHLPFYKLNRPYEFTIVTNLPQFTTKR